MKKYFLIIPIFIILLSLIAFYLLRNSEITDSVNKLSDVKQISYELEILIKKQKNIVMNLDTEVNYDEIVKVNAQVEKQLAYYGEQIEILNDQKLYRLVKKIQAKNNVLQNIYEDIKTDNAVIKNSIAWLSKNYKIYLSQIDSEERVGKELLTYLFDVINSKKEVIEYKPIDVNIYESDKLNMHLRVINDKQKSIILLYEEFAKNDLTLEIDKVVLYTLKHLNELHQETESIIDMLVIMASFLLLFGFVVYIREVIISLEAQRLKNELQQFVDALNESAIVSKTDAKGVIQYVNDKFCEISGFTREELINHNHNVIRHPDMPSETFKNLWKTIQSKKVFKATIKNKTKSGGFYFVDTSIMPILDIKGEISEYLAVRYDVTELVHSRDMAIVAEKAKSEFLSNMSHELRTPLNAIVGFSSILTRSIKDEKHLKYLQNILESSNNLIGLINDILDLSKLQSGKFTLDYNTFNAKEKTTVLLASLQPLAENASIEIQINLDDSTDVSLNGDWLRISQIITNILSNAIKFSPKDKVVKLDLLYKDSELIIKIVDEGIGLSQEAQMKIFKPFEQADNSTTRVYGGTGLGLSIVLNLVEQMHGKIELDSTEGVGSDFEVSIPLDSVATKLVREEESETTQETTQLHGRVLVAEDNKTNQMLVGILLEEFGLTYSMANDGVEAVDMFGRDKYDLVLMDENMPNLNGSEAMRRIHSLYGYETPIVALTANAMEGDRERFIEEGMHDYVAKPIDESKLYNVIKKCLDK